MWAMGESRNKNRMLGKMYSCSLNSAQAEPREVGCNCRDKYCNPFIVFFSDFLLLMSLIKWKGKNATNVGKQVKLYYQIHDHCLQPNRNWRIKPFLMPGDNSSMNSSWDKQRIFVNLHVWPDLILHQCSLPLLLQSLQLQHGCLKFSLLGQLPGNQLLLLSLSLRQLPLLLQVDLLQLCPLCCLLLQQPAKEHTARILQFFLLFFLVTFSLLTWLLFRMEANEELEQEYMVGKCGKIRLFVYNKHRAQTITH